jgi:hypothetical protein
MKLTAVTLLIATALLGVAQLVGAGEIKTGASTDAASSKPLTRAQVLADLALWRQSGMQDIDRADGLHDTTSERYRQAMARYQALRESQAHELPVKKTERNTREAEISAPR